MKQLIFFLIIGCTGLAGLAQSKGDTMGQADSLKPYGLIAGGSKGIGY